MPSKPRNVDFSITVSIVNYNTADDVVKSIEFIIKEISEFEKYNIYIIENSSPHNDSDVISNFIESRRISKFVHLICASNNNGFAAGNNIAFREMSKQVWTPNCVLVLNPDTIVRPGSVRELVSVMMGDSRIGVVGGRQENFEGTSWVAAFHFPTIVTLFAGATGIGVLQRRWPTIWHDVDVPAKVDWVSGAAMLIRTEAILQANGMDEEYFLYFEETDFMKEIASLGWETWHAPNARVLHVGGGSTGIVEGKPKQGRMPEYWFDSWFRYFSKQHGPAYARLAAATVLFGLTIKILHRKLRKKPTEITPFYFRDFAKKCLFRPVDIRVKRGMLEKQSSVRG